jgi:pimeloyl-ACP methyl ester carboxylesterase
MISRNYCNTKRLKQHYLCNYSESNPTKEVLLFIHGNGSSSTFWESIIGDDLLKKYHCIAPDLRGYGLTEAMPIDATKSMQDVVLDLEELLKKLSISKVHLIAHSLGGAVAYQFAVIISYKNSNNECYKPLFTLWFWRYKGSRRNKL